MKIVAALIALLSGWQTVPGIPPENSAESSLVHRWYTDALPDLRKVSISALARDSTTLAVGLRDGTLILCNTDGEPQGALSASESSPIRAIHLAPDSVTWQCGGRWLQMIRSSRIVTVLASPPILPAPTVTRVGLELRLADGTRVSAKYRDTSPVRSEGGPCAESRKSVWWAEGELLIRYDRETKAHEAFLPWSGAGGKIQALAADGRGVWIATERGLRHFYITDRAFDGYIRARLRPGEEEPPSTELHVQMALFMADWQGVPYLWGGNTKAGCDCSGFVGMLFRQVGLTLPRTSSDIARSGTEVEGDLQWGDIICTPGHVAVYIGNGRTVEALGSPSTGGAVGKSTIWRRVRAQARRVLP